MNGWGCCWGEGGECGDNEGRKEGRNEEEDDGEGEEEEQQQHRVDRGKGSFILQVIMKCWIIDVCLFVVIIIFIALIFCTCGVVCVCMCARLNVSIQRVFVCITMCNSPWSAELWDGLVIVSHYPPRKNSKFIWVRLNPLIHHTLPSPLLKRDSNYSLSVKNP